MRRPFYALAVLVCVWVLVLRTHLVLAHSQAPWLEGLGYVVLDLGSACLVLAAAALMCCQRRLGWQLAASSWLALVLLIYGIAYGSFHKTGSLLDWETLVMVVSHWRDLRIVLGSEIAAVDYLLFAVPVLILALPNVKSGVHPMRVELQARARHRQLTGWQWNMLVDRCLDD